MPHRHRPALFSGVALSAALLLAAPPASAQDAAPAILAPAAAPPAAHGHLLPTLIGAAAGAYLWPLLFPAAAEVAVAGSGGGALATAVDGVVALPAAAAESVGVTAPALGVSETVSAWRVGAWYPSIIGAIHGAYAGYLIWR